jgi:hypothetical protein
MILPQRREVSPRRGGPSAFRVSLSLFVARVANVNRRLEASDPLAYFYARSCMGRRRCLRTRC